MTPRYDLLLTDATLCTFAGASGYGLVERGAVGVRDGRIAYAGPASEVPEPERASATRALAGALVLPGLVDCHTHLVFAGNRAAEFERRLQGASYEDIARAGGGIASTVRATRAADDDALHAASLPRLLALLREGVTTIEVKSGYGLELEAERRTLRVARRLGLDHGITVRTTFLGLHALPPEFRDRRADYVARVADEMLPILAAEGLVDAVDAYCEGIGFTREEVTRVFERAKSLGLPVKLHAEQLSNQHGAALVASHGGLSADHLEHLDDRGIAAMAAARTVAVLLPGAYYALRDTMPPPVEKLAAAGVPIAIASDLNPGTSPLRSLLLAANLACTLFRMSPEQALRGITRHAAEALGLGDRKGTIEAGKDADLAVYAAAHPAELCYWIGGHEAMLVLAAGRPVHEAPAA